MTIQASQDDFSALQKQSNLAARPNLATRYGGSVPRYTSYPTAPHFTETVDGDVYANWLADIPAGSDLSLYLHVPFCAEMCWYCGCFTKIVKRQEPVSDYVNTLIAEAQLVASQMQAGQHLKFIHWGGGSPTMLAADDWSRVMHSLSGLFHITDTAEIAIELDPRTTTEDYIKTLAAVGVNRISIGVQEFDLDIQKAINRIQPLETTKRVVDWIRDAGINQLNLDLMYGLPGQSIAHIEAMTRNALRLAPQRIALFGYAHVPWMKSHQRLINEDDLPDAMARWQSAQLAADILTDAGYVRVGFDHFALPDDPIVSTQQGTTRRNFQGYTTDTADALIGLGASAIGALPQGYVQNIPSLKSYSAAITAGRFATKRGFQLSQEDKLRRAVIERIMVELEIDLATCCQSFDMPENYLDADLAGLENMARDGLITTERRHIRVTEAGRPLIRHVAAAFDAYLATGKARHSSGV